MTPEHQYVPPDKLDVDKKKRYHLQTPEGKEEIIELTDKEIEAIENWFALLGKHSIRFEIETILQLFNELNLTEISHMVKQSKSTVDRHLRSMEEDALLVSRKGRANDKGRIPPRLYKLNRKIYKILQSVGNTGSIEPPDPKDSKKLIEKYQRKIDTYRSLLFRYTSLLKMVNPLLNKFENQLNDVNLAKQIFEDYFDPKTTMHFPIFGYTYFSEKYIGKFFELNLEYEKRLQELLVTQNADPEAKEKSFVFMAATLPIRKYFDIYKREILDNK